MDTSNTLDASQFSGFSASDTNLDFCDKNNGVLYTVKETCLGETITITFFTREVFDQAVGELSDYYEFTPNQAGHGQSVTTSLCNQKVVITIYKTLTLVVQGKESRLWRYTVFRSISDSLSNEASTASSAETVPPSTASSAETVSPSTTSSAETVSPSTTSSAKSVLPMIFKKSKSTSFLGNISKAIFGPSPNKEMLKIGKELQKAKKKKVEINQEEFDRQIKAIQKTGKKPKEKLHKMGQRSISGRPLNYQYRKFHERTSRKTHETKPKTLDISSENDITYLSTSECEQTPQNTEDVPSETEKDTEAADSRNSSDPTEGTTNQQGTPSQDHEQITQNTEEIPSGTGNGAETAKQQDTPQCICTHESVMKEQKDTINSLEKEIIQLKSENKKLTATCEELASKTEMSRQKQSEEKKQCNKHTMTTNTESQNNSSQKKNTVAAEEKLAELNEKMLILEDENKKLKESVTNLKKENKAMQKKLSERQQQAEINEDLTTGISNITSHTSHTKDAVDDVKQKLETVPKIIDITLLQQEVRRQNTEIASIREEIRRQSSSSVPQATEIGTNSAASTSTARTPTNEKRQTEPAPNQSKNKDRTVEPEKDSKPKVAILGDSVTKGLDAKLFSGQSLDVKIKSHPGATIRDISNSIPSVKEKLNIAECTLIVIHAGVNNVSNADDPETILQEYKELISKLLKINDSTKLCISSILPKKHDKLSLKNIEEANKLLEQMCEDQGHVFVNHTKRFTNNGTADRTLYRDEVHLTNNGTALLAKHLKTSVFKSLDFPEITSQSGNFRQASQAKRMGYQHHNPKWQQHPARWSEPQRPPGQNRPQHPRRWSRPQHPPGWNRPQPLPGWNSPIPPWARFPPMWMPQPY